MTRPLALMDRPRPTVKRRDIEGPIMRAVIMFLRWTLRGAVVHHSPNEVGVRGNEIARAIAKAKRNGMIKGFPDVICLWRSQTWTFEVKAPGEKPTPEQIAIGQDIIAQGGKWAVVYSVDDAHQCISKWASEMGWEI